MTLAINYWGAFYLTHLLLSRINQQPFSRCTMAVAVAVSTPPLVPFLPHLILLPSAHLILLPSVHTWSISQEGTASLFWLQDCVREQH